MCWEAYYPHSDSTWPDSPERFFASATAAGLADDEIAAITHGNAMRHFQYDPFAHRSREASTVGALRAEAAAAGVSTVPVPRFRRHEPPSEPLTLLQLLDRASHPLLDEQRAAAG